MNDGVPPPIAISAAPTLTPPMALRHSSAFSHDDIYIFDITANQSNLIVSASSHEIKLYNPSTLAINRVLKFHTDAISQIKAHGDNFIFSSSKDGHVALWDLRTEGAPVQTYSSARRDPLLSFDLNCAEQVLAAGTELNEEMYEAYIHFFDTRMASATNSANNPVVKTFNESHSDDVTQIKFHPTNPMRLMSGSVDGLVCQMDISQEEDDAMEVVANTEASIHKIGYFGPQAEYIYALSHMETLSLWMSDQADMIHNFGDVRGVSNPALGLTLDYMIDCQYDPVTQRLFLLAGSNEGNINILHVNSDSLQLCQVLQGCHTEIVRGIAWHPQRGIMYSGGEDARLGLWTTADAQGPFSHTSPTGARHSSPLQQRKTDPRHNMRSSPYQR
ncbi:WD repeat-containing protein 89 [Actinomortierella wolfii]|nr:WD repeat-containing protein 89 [Actinomortierella wolfii]